MNRAWAKIHSFEASIGGVSSHEGFREENSPFTKKAEPILERQIPPGLIHKKTKELVARFIFSRLDTVTLKLRVFSLNDLFF